MVAGNILLVFVPFTWQVNLKSPTPTKGANDTADVGSLGRFTMGAVAKTI